MSQHGRDDAAVSERLRQLHAIYELSAAISRADDLETIYEEALRCLGRTLGADRAAVLLFDAQGVMRFHAQSGLSAAYRAAAEGHSPWTQESLDPAPVLVPDVAKDPDLAALRPRIEAEGIAALLFVPLLQRGRLLGKLMVYYDAPHAFEAEEVQLAQTIAAHIALGIDRRRSEDTLALIAAASAELAASIDLPTTLKTVGQVLTPRLCDWSAVYLVEEGRLKKAAVHHPDPALAEEAQALVQRMPADLYPGHPVRAVIDSGEAACDNDLSEEALRRGSLDDAHLQLLQRLGARARLCVPLRCRGGVIGALLLGKSAGRFDREERRRAEQLAWRCAMALDNARLYQEAQDAVRAREEFLSIASHEIRAPLNTLHLQLQLLQRAHAKGQLGAADPARIGAMLESGDRQIRKLTQLIDKLFDLSRIAAGRLELHLEEVDLSQLCSDVAAASSAALQEAGCALSLSIKEGVVGRWDRVRLEQVVTNLLANAMKYGAGKPVELRVEAEGRAARLVVADGGIGIAKEKQRQIFERFERAAGKGYGGLGLGLYIVRRILSAMGGQIRVDSQLGEGCTFVVELPRGEPGA